MKSLTNPCIPIRSLTLLHTIIEDRIKEFLMLGAIVGDFIGSRFEFNPLKDETFDLIHNDCVYTDDTVLTIAVAESFATGKPVADRMRFWVNEVVTSYGMGFWQWSQDKSMGPYGSWSNGASMRTSPAVSFARNFDHALELAALQASVTHNHPEGIRGAQATTAAIYAAASGWTQEQTRQLITDLFGYDLSRSPKQVARTSEFELKSWICVPEALICAFSAVSFEDCMRKVIALRADADTQCAIAGAIAQHWFPIPGEMIDAAIKRMPEELRNALAFVMQASREIPFESLTPSQIPQMPLWDPQSAIAFERDQKQITQSDLDEMAHWEDVESKMQMALSKKPRRFMRFFGL